jgi:hypothetical protein
MIEFIRSQPQGIDLSNVLHKFKAAYGFDYIYKGAFKAHLIA